MGALASYPILQVLVFFYVEIYYIQGVRVVEISARNIILETLAFGGRILLCSIVTLITQIKQLTIYARRMQLLSSRLRMSRTPELTAYDHVCT
jgi:hypothetical protein